MNATALWTSSTRFLDLLAIEDHDSGERRLVLGRLENSLSKYWAVCVLQSRVVLLCLALFHTIDQQGYGRRQCALSNRNHANVQVL